MYNITDPQLPAVLATACFRLQINGKFTRILRVLCDPGAQANVINNSVVEEFNLQRTATKKQLRSADGSIMPTRGQVEIELWHHSIEQPITKASFVIIKGHLPDHPRDTFGTLPFGNLAPTDYADPFYNQQNTIDALICVTEVAENIRDGIIRNSSSLIAFGWIVFGGDAERNGKFSIVNVVPKDELHALINKLWDIDEPLEESLQNEWRQFYAEINNINEIKIPRCLQTTAYRKIQIHFFFFTDASMKAYGVAVYVRVLTETGWRARQDELTSY